MVKSNAQRLEFRDDGKSASAGAENTLFKRGDTGTLTSIIADKTSYQCAVYDLFSLKRLPVKVVARPPSSLPLIRKMAQ